jgi:hypothetical protein
MSLDTYTNLKTEISDWLARADSTSIADTLIDLAEAQASRLFRLRQMESEATATAAEFVALPSDFIEMRDLQYVASPVVSLEYITPELADVWYSSGASGIPKFYTLVGNQIRLIPPPSSSSTDIRISYWQKVPALTSLNTTNWLLTDYPDYYLFGSLMYGRAWLQDVNTAAAIKAGFDRVMAEIDRAGRRSNVGGSLTIRPA